MGAAGRHAELAPWRLDRTDQRDLPLSATSQDCNGHGTHVAGTAARTAHGVAKAAAIVPVRAMDCDGLASTSTVVAGIDWVTKHHTSGDPAVANLSIWAKGFSGVIDTAINASIAYGTT